MGAEEKRCQINNSCAPSLQPLSNCQSVFHGTSAYGLLCRKANNFQWPEQLIPQPTEIEKLELLGQQEARSATEELEMIQLIGHYMYRPEPSPWCRRSDHVRPTGHKMARSVIEQPGLVRLIGHYV